MPMSCYIITLTTPRGIGTVLAWQASIMPYVV